MLWRAPSKSDSILTIHKAVSVNIIISNAHTFVVLHSLFQIIFVENFLNLK